MVKYSYLTVTGRDTNRRGEQSEQVIAERRTDVALQRKRKKAKWGETKSLFCQPLKKRFLIWLCLINIISICVYVYEHYTRLYGYSLLHLWVKKITMRKNWQIVQQQRKVINKQNLVDTRYNEVIIQLFMVLIYVNKAIFMRSSLISARKRIDMNKGIVAEYENYLSFENSS